MLAVDCDNQIDMVKRRKKNKKKIKKVDIVQPNREIRHNINLCIIMLGGTKYVTARRKMEAADKKDL